MPYLKGLNPDQEEAVTHPGGPLLVLAGAGTGKTRVLTTRVAYLIKEKRERAGAILAVTFTNKAAGEMRERVATMVGAGGRGVWLSTFHGLGLRILRREGGLLGIGKDFTIFNDADQISLVKQILKDMSIGKAFSPRAILSRIDAAKNELVGPEDYVNNTDSDFFTSRVARVYPVYQQKLRELGGVDFGDLITETVRLFKEKPRVLESYAERFSHVLVDEYQDTNRAQYILMNQLSSVHGNIFAVGDPDQSIYGWRGADIRNILDFQDDWPRANVLRLEQNYRSTSKILAAANSCISYNSERMDKELWTENDAGEHVFYEEALDERDEVRQIVSRAVSLSKEDKERSFSDMAIFYRTNAQSRVFEEYLIREGIPYNIVGGLRFYERKEVKDALALLRLAMNPFDEIALRRVINVPPRGIGAVTVEKITALAMEKNISAYDAFGEAITGGLITKPAAKKFYAVMEAFKDGLGRVPLHELSMKLLEDTGYLSMLVDEKTEESLDRAENLHELVSAIKDFEAGVLGAAAADDDDDDEADGEEDADGEETRSPLAAFLDHVALISDIDTYEQAKERLTLMTIHAAKGLEFPVVFIAGIEEGLFPHSRSSDNAEEIEEERRLCYVGMTRAKERLFLSSAATRSIYGETRYQLKSRFIDEIGSEHLMSSADMGSSRSGDDMYYTFDEGASHNDDELQTFDYDDIGESRAPDTVTAAPAKELRVGMKVSHPSFGTGVVRAKEGSGEDAKLTVVFFRGVGPKKLIVKYAGLIPA